MEAVTPPPSVVESPEPPLKRRGVSLPAWLAVLIVLLVTAGAGYGGWKLLAPAPPVDLTQYESNENRPGANRPNRPGGGGGGGNAQAFVEGVKLNPDGGGTAQTARFGIQVLAGPTPRLMATNRGGRPTGEDARVVRARNQLLNNNNNDARRAANVTDGQIKRLREVSMAQPPAVTPATSKTLLDLWAKLRAASPGDRPAAEKAVLDAVREAERAHNAARAAAFATQAAAIRGILNADQLTKLAPGR